LPVAAAKVFLAVQGVGREQDAVQAQLLDQRLGRRDLVALGDLLMGQDERRLAGERAEHLGGGLVVQVVEAAPQRLAVERDDPPPRRGGDVTRMLAWRWKAASIAAGSSACKRARSVLTAGARRKRAPKVTFSRSRCTPMNRRMRRQEVAPARTASTANSSKGARP
jgi:hypothetical protein